MIVDQPIYFYTASVYNFQMLLADDKIKEIIISSLQYLINQKRLKLYAYVIMSNHIHFIWEEIISEEYNESSKAAFMKFTSHQFQKTLRKDSPESLENFKVTKSDRNFQFWNRIPLSIEIYSRKVMEQKLDYIYNNPVQEQWDLVDEPQKYKYSSARFYEEEIDELGFYLFAIMYFDSLSLQLVGEDTNSRIL